jgi:integrase
LTRTVLSGLCALACRHNALSHNPMSDVGAIRTEARPATALTEPEARQVRAYLTYDERSVRRDIPDFVDIMLATSLRIGECAAIHWPDVDLQAGTLRVRGNVVRLRGRGLLVNQYESNKLTHRTLRLPNWAVEMLQRRRSTMDGDGPVFPAPAGGLRDPSNTQADLRDAFTFAGRPGLTSHVFRKTVATLMDTSGRTPRNVSDQLGHSQTAMAQNKYMGRQITDTGAADILEALAF